MTHSKLEQQLQSLLRDSEDNIAPEVRQQLTAARQAALAEQPAPRHWFNWAGMATAMASIAVVAMLAVPIFFNGDTLGTAEPDEPVLAQDSELYEDLEFYQWLVETDAINNSG